jgi:NAD(P)-dependent dehydrogenase (short-subunit alcohol dehydrogenase family)
MSRKGASRGIGHATVKRFAGAGWRVITCSRQPFAEACPWEAGPEDHIVLDLGDRHSLAAGLAKMQERLAGAPLHALVNNAGISPKEPQGERLDTLQTEMPLWGHVFQVNFFAPVMLARGLLDDLQRGQGTVVNVTSIAESRMHRFAGAAYATSKAALAALTREMAADLGPLGIRVNAIAPGEIATSILSSGTADIVLQLPYRDAIRLIFTRDPASEAALFRTKQADMMRPPTLDILYELMKTVPDLWLYRVPSLEWGGYQLTLRLDKAPFNDVRVRRALSMAINREVVVEVVNRGNAALYGPFP